MALRHWRPSTAFVMLASSWKLLNSHSPDISAEHCTSGNFVILIWLKTGLRHIEIAISTFVRFWMITHVIVLWLILTESVMCTMRSRKRTLNFSLNTNTIFTTCTQKESWSYTPSTAKLRKNWKPVSLVFISKTHFSGIHAWAQRNYLSSRSNFDRNIAADPDSGKTSLLSMAVFLEKCNQHWKLLSSLI